MEHHKSGNSTRLTFSRSYLTELHTANRTHPLTTTYFGECGPMLHFPINNARKKCKKNPVNLAFVREETAKNL